ncbi:MAG: cytochrome P450 [Myxococcaceae bacterium]
MMDFLTDEMRRNPYPLYAQMREGAPLLNVPGTKMWMVFDYENVKRVMSEHELFASRATPPGAAAPPDWLIFMDPPRHTKLRALILKAFTPKAVAALEPRIRELTKELLDQHVPRGEMDLVDDFSVQLPALVIGDMLGIPFEDRPRLKRWNEAILGLADGVIGTDPKGSAQRYFAAKEEMTTYVAEMIAARTTNPRDDLMTRLVQAEVDGERLSHSDILGFFMLLIFAGTETTTNLINNAIVTLLEHPAELEKLKANPALTQTAIEEVLRYRSPAQVMFRETKVELQLHGQTIPAGTLILPVIGSANRDPKQFQNPDTFDITRNPNPHIGFGHGIHFCIGAPLSRLEAKVALPALLSRLQNLRLASDEPWEPRKAFNVHGPTHLPIRFEPGDRL